MGSAVQEIVAIDIGGTHARFARAHLGTGGSVRLGDPVTIRTAEFADLAAAWARFRALQPEARPVGAALAVAAPIDRDCIAFTNNDWVVPRADLSAILTVSRCVVVNDFEAVAHAVATAEPTDFAHICGPDQPLTHAGTISVVGPGTGLGVAHLRRFEDRTYNVTATEGGHIGFAPVDDIDDRILASLRQELGRVSAERVVSGPGIRPIYRALTKTAAVPEEVAIWTAGIAGEDDQARVAVLHFCRALGSVAGDLALAQGAQSVAISGGLGHRLRHILPASDFGKAFCAKGRFSALMEQIPVRVMTQAEPGLHGAAAAFAREQILEQDR